MEHNKEAPQAPDQRGSMPPDPEANDPTTSLREALASLKKPADNKYFRHLGPDGIFRILTYLPSPPDKTTPISVYDGVPLSPPQIKAYLDRQPWSQEVEDRFRGVDGRTVPQGQWFQPPLGVLPNMGSKDQREEDKRRFREEERVMKERIEKGEVGEEEVGPACGSARSDFDLSPREGDGVER